LSITSKERSLRIAYIVIGEYLFLIKLGNKRLEINEDLLCISFYVTPKERIHYSPPVTTPLSSRPKILQDVFFVILISHDHTSIIIFCQSNFIFYLFFSESKPNKSSLLYLSRTTMNTSDSQRRGGAV
jgi:hypothetical protein